MLKNKREITNDVMTFFRDEVKDKGSVNAAANFLDIGGDSLGMMNVISRLEDKYKIELDPRIVLRAPTPEKIAELIMKGENNEPVITKEKISLKNEITLPEDIRPCGGYDRAASESENIFLTGATGFLGAFLIRDILNRNGKTTVFCLVRCSDIYSGLERIKANMQHYKCWKNEYRTRITVIKGDLIKPHFGVDDDVWQTLCANIDSVIHCGAVLNFLYPYSAMKSSNVLSTVEALRLCTTGKMKYMNYISSYSVYDNPSHFGKNVLEDDPLDSPDGYFLGYSQTKWVCEKLIQEAEKRNIAAKIYRPGDITGTKADGIWEVRDLTSRMIIGCVQMKTVPIVDMTLNFTPVDYVSAAITHIAFSDTHWDKAFNIINPNIKSSFELFKALLECKIPVVPVPYKLWKAALKKANIKNNALKILESMFTDSGSGDIITRHMERQPIYDMFNTTTELIGSGIKCPPMDKELLKSYIMYFKRARMI